jgi:hypothetical protein
MFDRLVNTIMFDVHDAIQNLPGRCRHGDC